MVNKRHGPEMVRGLWVWTLLVTCYSQCDTRWRVEGLGHCTEPVLEIWKDQSLAGCLRKCEQHARCSYASFVDDALLRSSLPVKWSGDGAFSGGKLCLHFAQCEVLRSTIAGATTFSCSSDAVQPDSPKWQGKDEAVTISTSRSLSSSKAWQLRKQLCIHESPSQMPSTLAVLKDSCADFWSVKFVSGPIMSSRGLNPVGSVTTLKVTIQHGKGFLCSHGPSVGEGGWNMSGLQIHEFCRQDIWDMVRAGESEPVIDSEPCWWVRKAQDGNWTEGQYLSVSGNAGMTFLPWSEDMSSSCWNFGYEQSRMHHSFVGRDDLGFSFDSEVPDYCRELFGKQTWQCQNRKTKQVPHIWLMVSPKYNETMQRLLSTFDRAGEAVRITVRWVPDFKATMEKGFALTMKAGRSRQFYNFNYRKLLLSLEAYLEAVLSQDGMVVIMDLDVQVWREWTQVLQSCMKNADMCFTQMGFGDNWQLANAGVIVFKATAAVGAFYHALAARLQTSDILERFISSDFPSRTMVAIDQMMINYQLQKISNLTKSFLRNGTFTLRWGVYNPLLAYTGMFLPATPLSLAVQHATSSVATLNAKLRLMDATQLFTEDLRELCPVRGNGFLDSVGPLLEFCYVYVAVDPHFGALLEPYRSYKGFNFWDSLFVQDELEQRARVTWMQLLSAFNFDGGRRYVAKRRNSSRALAQVLMFPPESRDDYTRQILGKFLGVRRKRSASLPVISWLISNLRSISMAYPGTNTIHIDMI